MDVPSKSRWTTRSEIRLEKADWYGNDEAGHLPGFTLSGQLGRGRMLTVIKQLLSADEVAQFRKHLDAAPCRTD
jgi:hypothetical protein